MSKDKKKKEKGLRKYYCFFKDYERIGETCSMLVLILAGLMTLPYLAEIQMAWLGSIVILAVAINHTIKKIEHVHPELKAQYEKDQFKTEIYDKIKELKKEVKKLKDEKEKQKS